MNGKNPAFQFYPNDWARDLEEHPLEIEGAWIRICCKLWWSETKGELTRTTEQWARILRANISDTERIINYIEKEQIGNVKRGCNANVTLTCRRMIRDENIRELTRLRVAKHREKDECNADVQKCNAPVTPMKQPSSSSSSSSSSKKRTKPCSSSDERFTTFWSAYPKKVGKGKAEKAWKKIPTPATTLEAILKALEWQKKSEQWAKEYGTYIPHPATYLNEKRWEDEPNGKQADGAINDNLFLRSLQQKDGRKPSE